MSPTKKNQKGVSLYLTIVILSVLTASLLALTSIAISQIKVIYKIGDSVVAFYAADSGAEQLLYEKLLYESPGGESYLSANAGKCPVFSGNVGLATYRVCVDSSGTSVYSTGTYKETERRVGLNFE